MTEGSRRLSWLCCIHYAIYPLVLVFRHGRRTASCIEKPPLFATGHFGDLGNEAGVFRKIE